MFPAMFLFNMCPQSEERLSFRRAKEAPSGSVWPLGLSFPVVVTVVYFYNRESALYIRANMAHEDVRLIAGLVFSGLGFSSWVD